MDFIIGNNFLKLYHPFIQELTYIVLKAPHDSSINQKSKRIKIPTTTIDKILKFKIFSILETCYLNLYFQINIPKNNLEIKIEELLDEICAENPLDIKNTNNELVSIKLKDSTKEINVPNKIPYSARDREEFSLECKDLLEKGIIRLSKSPHAAPAFYVENNNEIKREKRKMVINYKKMNEATIGDAHKLPRKDSILEKIKGATWFSSLDAKSGYWQLRLDEETKKLTAFTCPTKESTSVLLYEWNVLPFGLKQAPGIYQRFMEENLKELNEFVLVYIDDILIFTKQDKEDHLQKLLIVLERCKEKGLVLSKKKARIAKQEIEFLGLILSTQGKLKLQPNVLEKVNLFPNKIEDRKQLPRFLGCINYISDQGFLKNITEYTKSLFPKISTKKEWKWDEKDSMQIQKIKELCEKLPELYIPEENDYLIVETDASDITWSGCLKAKKAIKSLEQEKESLDSKYPPKELLCRYISGTFTPTEQRYTTHEKETLAAIKSLKKWKIDLLPKEFTLRTDSSYLTGFIRYNLKVDYNHGRLVRWQLFLLQYPIKIEYIKGDKNVIADTLTREWSSSTTH